METMDRQDCHNRAIKFLDNGGDCDDRDDHMETRLNFNTPNNNVAYDVVVLVSIFKIETSQLSDSY